MAATGLVERKSLVDGTIEAMRAQIAERTWRVGDRIPPEADLAASFGVGRNTVREAIRVLSNANMLEVRQGDGTYVRSEVDAVQTVRSLVTMKLLDHLELQQMLETEAARYAAARATPSDIATLHFMLDRRSEYVRREGGTPAELDDFLDRDVDFHKAIAAASHNTALQALYAHFAASMRMYTRELLEQGGTPEPDLAAHRAIVDAIESRDEDAASLSAHRMLLPLIKKLRAEADAAN